MGIMDFFNKIAGKFDSDHIENTTGEIKRASNLADETVGAVSGKDADLLSKTLGAGTRAALAAGALTGIIMPEIAGIVAATAFVGTTLYRFYKGITQKAVLSTIQKDGLTPNGNPISNGINNQVQKVSMRNQQITK